MDVEAEDVEQGEGRSAVAAAVVRERRIHLEREHARMHTQSFKVKKVKIGRADTGDAEQCLLPYWLMSWEFIIISRGCWTKDSWQNAEF